MTPQELIVKLVSIEGPCGRLCSYCDEQFDTAEVKECVESMIRKIYLLQSNQDRIMKEMISMRQAYKEATGKEYPCE